MLTELQLKVIDALTSIAKAIDDNDVDALDAPIAVLNENEITDEDYVNITEIVNYDRYPGALTEHREAYLKAVNDINSITDKEYRVKTFIVREALDSNDLEVMRAVLEEQANSEEILDANVDDYNYITMLLKLCVILRDYDTMDKIRNRLVV